MDGERFDILTKTLVNGGTRRQLLRGLVGAVAATVAARGQVRAAPNSCALACAGYPGPQKAVCKQACRACGGDVDRVCPQFGPTGVTGFVCCPESTICGFSGDCIEITVCPKGETAENCEAGITTNCGSGGVCALVDDADAEDCQCVERVCTGIPCATDADCTEFGFLCVSIPGCCPETTFCGIPCGAAGTGTTTTGWG